MFGGITLRCNSFQGCDVAYRFGRGTYEIAETIMLGSGQNIAGAGANETTLALGLISQLRRAFRTTIGAEKYERVEATLRAENAGGGCCCPWPSPNMQHLMECPANPHHERWLAYTRGTAERCQL